MTAYDVLNELSELVGAVWNIEVNRASTLAEYLGTASEPLQFYATATGPAPAIWAYDFYDTPSFKPFRFTFLVRDDFPILPAPADCWGLQKMVESYNLRTVQVVKGQLVSPIHRLRHSPTRQATAKLACSGRSWTCPQSLSTASLLR